MTFDWNLPYASRRQPVFARNAVATSQPLATQAGIAMLAKGGNAVDAALATAITLTVVEPCSNGLGSDLFALVWTGSELVGLNASGRAPAAWNPRRFAGRAAMHERGWETVTIPGAVSGLARAVAALRRIAVRRSLRARDPLRARRLSRVAGRRGEMGARASAHAARPRVVRAFRAARARALPRRALRQSRDGRVAGTHRADGRRRVLPRRTGGRDGAACARVGRARIPRRTLPRTRPTG